MDKKLLEFKRRAEIIIADGIRTIMNLKKDDPIKDVNTFFNMSEKLMKLVQEDFNI